MVSRKARLQKRADYMRHIGIPMHVSPAEMAEVRKLCVELRDQGMSFTQIGASTHPPVGDTTVIRLVQGIATQMHRDTYERLLKVRYIEPTVRFTGRHIEPFGMLRRLQALVAAGFSYAQLAEMCGGVTPDAIRQLAVRESTILTSTHNMIAALYSKLQHADPFAYGGTVRTVSVAKGVARRRGWPPPMCWDEDTLDDALAQPEWTGACGTNEGYWLHKKYDIEVCPACRLAGRDNDPPLDPRFDRKLFRQMREERGWNAAALAKKAGLDPGTVASWEKGRTRPKGVEKLTRVCKVLGVDPELFFPSEET